METVSSCFVNKSLNLIELLNSNDAESPLQF